MQTEQRGMASRRACRLLLFASRDTPNSTEAPERCKLLRITEFRRFHSICSSGSVQTWFPFIFRERRSVWGVFEYILRLFRAAHAIFHACKTTRGEDPSENERLGLSFIGCARMYFLELLFVDKCLNEKNRETHVYIFRNRETCVWLQNVTETFAFAFCYFYELLNPTFQSSCEFFLVTSTILVKGRI